MLAAIVRNALRFRGALLALVCVWLGACVYALSQAKYDVFPEFALPQVTIQTEAPGLAPEQVEVLVTQPVENAIRGIAGIESMHSSAIQGLSVTTITFGSSDDVFRDRQVVAEHLATLIGQLPQGVQPPVMTPLTSSTGDLMTIGLTSTTRSLMELRTLAEWTLKPRLLATPGVAKVAIFGGDVKQLQIQVRPDQLVRYNVSLDEVLLVARRATGVLGAGVIDTVNQRFILHTSGQSLSATELAHTALVQQSGGSITANLTLGDVANVVEAPEPPISAATVMGEPGVILNLWAQYGANTLEVTQEVERALEEMRSTLDAEQVVMSPDLFRPANFIQKAVQNVQGSLLIGAILVIVVLFLFLFDVRAAVISCTAIPLSLMAAVTVLSYLGLSLNTMTLGGLAIAIGEVVDDAVIDVENIQRRLRENRFLPHPRPLLQVVLDASIEVRSAVVYATLAVVLVFIPILTMPGLAGRLFGPLGLAYILAILASLLVALTVTPALCLMLLKDGKGQPHTSPIALWLKKRYSNLLLHVDGAFRYVLGSVLLCTLLGVAAFFVVREEFLPELREGHFLVHVSAVPGTSLEESVRIGRRISRSLLEVPIVRTVAQRVGRAEADDTFGTHASEFELDLKPLTKHEAEDADSTVRDVLAQFPGLTFTVNTFLMERVEETLSGYTAPVIVKVFGNDLDVLDQKAQEVARVLVSVPGATDIQVESPPGTPELTIQLRNNDVARWGFDPVDVLEAVRTAYQGETVGQVYDGHQVYGVSVILDPTARKRVTDVGELPLRNPQGIYVRLRQLCDIRETSGRYAVLRDNARRVQAITCNIEGRDSSSFTREARRAILSAVTFPPETYVEVAGDAAAQARSQHELLLHSLLAAIGIIALLSMVMGSTRNLLLVLTNLPFALVGGILAVFLSGGSCSIGSMVGFVTLFGITVRNSIMLISHYEHLVNVEGVSWGRHTAFRGASERLVPILMTALVTALGLLPIALGSGEAGREIEGPMAVVILGGLVTSTALNLLVLPMLVLRYGRFAPLPEHEPSGQRSTA